jgi:hypothetical protein
MLIVHITTNVLVAQSADSKKTHGFISGSFSYPGEFIPADLKICAVSAHDSTVVFSTTEINRKRFTYKLKLPKGEYYVYAETNYFADRAYYSEYVICGMKVSCSSHKKLIVKVISKKKIKNINPTDWYHIQ